MEPAGIARMDPYGFQHREKFVVDPNFWTQKAAFLRWRAALKNKESQCLGTLRQWCKRLTRLTYAFSKKWENLRAALALHFAHYNFCRIHSSLRLTPAME